MKQILFMILLDSLLFTEFPVWAFLAALIIFGLVITLTGFYLNHLKNRLQIELEHEYAVKKEEVSRMKSFFFTNISREIRTPLEHIIAPADNIIASTQESETRKETLVIRRNALRLLELFNQLLDFSSLNEGSLKLQVSKNEIVSFVKKIAKALKSTVEEKDITVSVTADKKEVYVYFDKEKMEKVLINLISYSIKFTPAGGKINLMINDLSDHVQIKIKDTGIGIPADALPNIINSCNQEFSGTGIGLFLSKELVELHHGKIRADSKEGEGSEFTIELLKGRMHFNMKEILDIEEPDTLTEKVRTEFQKAKSFTTSGIENIVPAAGDEKIVLIVDDSKDVREYIKESLEKDFLFEEAAHKENGIRKVKSYKLSKIRKD